MTKVKKNRLINFCNPGRSCLSRQDSLPIYHSRQKTFTEENGQGKAGPHTTMLSPTPLDIPYLEIVSLYQTRACCQVAYQLHYSQNDISKWCWETVAKFERLSPLSLQYLKESFYQTFNASPLLSLQQFERLKYTLIYGRIELTDAHRGNGESQGSQR